MSVTGAVVLGLCLSMMIPVLVLGELVVTQFEDWVARLELECQGCQRPWTPSASTAKRFFIVPFIGSIALFVCGYGKLRGTPIRRSAQLFALLGFANFVERSVARGEIDEAASSQLLGELARELDLDLG